MATIITTPENKGRKKRHPESRTSPRRIESHQKAVKAVELRKAGMTYVQIAQAVGYGSPEAACKAVSRALEESIVEPTQGLIQLETERLDRLMLALWKDATNGNQGAVDRVLKIMERRAKLLGLDRPTKFEGDVNGTGGMLIIPAPVSMEDWEKMAQAHNTGVAAPAQVQE